MRQLVRVPPAHPAGDPHRLDAPLPRAMPERHHPPHARKMQPSSVQFEVVGAIPAIRADVVPPITGSSGARRTHTGTGAESGAVTGAALLVIDDSPSAPP